MNQLGPHETKPKRIDPLFNDMFVRLFGREESKSMTRAAINIILRKAGVAEIPQIDAIDAEYSEVGGSVECKTPRLDVRIIAGKRRVDLEAERREGDMNNRLLFYASRMLSNAVGKGESYREMPQVIMVALLDVPDALPKDAELIATCQMYWDYGTGTSGLMAASDRIILVAVDLHRLRARYTELTNEVMGDEFLALLYLLAWGYRSEEEVEDIMGKLPSMEDFEKMYGDALGDISLQRAYEYYQSSIMEENRIKDFWKDKGLEEGRAEGRAQGVDELASELRALGIDEALLETALEKMNASSTEASA